MFVSLDLLAPENSTFLRCINLLEQPDAGEILINGKDILKPGFRFRCVSGESWHGISAF